MIPAYIESSKYRGTLDIQHIHTPNTSTARSIHLADPGTRGGAPTVPSLRGARQPSAARMHGTGTPPQRQTHGEGIAEGPGAYAAQRTSEAVLPAQVSEGTATPACGGEGDDLH